MLVRPAAGHATHHRQRVFRRCTAMLSIHPASTAVCCQRCAGAAIYAPYGPRAVAVVKYGGLKFLEVAHVKDLLALLGVG